MAKNIMGPASGPLATLTDLSAKEVAAVAKAVNPLIADAFAVYVKTKNFHWHLSGSHFRDYHLLFDEQAETIFASIDVMAERLRKIGATSIRSIGHIAELQTVEDDNDEFVPPGEMIKRLLTDNDTMARAMRAAIEVCDDNRDSPTGNLLQEILDQTERRKWFLFEIAQGEENAA
jgi:starvation-inducible DNA-binding protein